MKTKFANLASSLLVACLLIFVIVISCKTDKTDKKEKTDQQPVAYENVEKKNNDCNCEPTWFPHTQTPPPEEGKGSPFDTTSTTNCIFQQWSWQKFLWLTKPDNGTTVFENKLIQVSDLMIPVEPQSGLSLVLKDIEQAGSDGVLKTNPQFNSSISKSDTVYYSIHISDTLKVAADHFKTAILDGSIPHNNTETFPIGSLELKVSWVKTSAIPTDKLSTYYQTKAAIYENGTYVKSDVALLGMHVVGVVINHPEFIWATFEHNDMAPYYDWNTNTVSSPDEKLLYGKGTTSSLDGITWSGNQPKEPNKAFTLFEFGVPRTQGNGFMETSQKEPENYDNIKNLNSCVAAKLKDVWKNYFYNGGIWIDTDGLPPQKQADTIQKLAGNISHATKGSIAKGSLNLSNLTMETYTQTFQSDVHDITVNNLVNCFVCHNSENFNEDKAKSPLYLSHIFNAYLQHGAGKTHDEINTLKIKEFNEQFMKKG
ncbi:hypothetical protein ATO12_24535 [Aquimarina atlantica]|uniref:Cytochrome c domain-containing protein n=1 Tax=Aquimarina atlantica TaxID=1317122 RepID=A0A023BR03_9FLAO|nr:hypothetical protein [Aquimarina atlantica]EZH72108.1 hypothetical protein ATO12_24535 [Aquimarina atlantica]